LECKVWIFEKVIHQDNEFAHDRSERDFGGFACGTQPLIELFELTVGMSGDECGQPIYFHCSPSSRFANLSVMHRLIPPWLLFVAVLSARFVAAAAGAARFVFVADSPEIRFAADEINRAALAASVSNSRPSISFQLDTNLSAQAYRIEHSNGTVRIIGGDATGAMYGGLDAAEAIRSGTLSELKDGTHRPYIARRGIKFNLPLDLRTPSYSDCSDAFQANIPEVWDMDFWRLFLDTMARDRFNVLTLWNLHPFPSIVKVSEYPDVALDDVWRTTIKLDDSFRSTATDMVRPAMLAQHEVVKKMTIEQKIRFWRDVMDYAHDRGIEVYLFTWNIYTYGTEGKHGITPAQTNRVTMDYFRKSVRETVLTYPRLAGIGITAGEQMQEGPNELGKESWLWDTYGEGIRDALKQQPGREFRLIHRFHQTGFEAVQNAWSNYPGPFEFSLKYSIAHMYSSPTPTFINEALPHLGPEQKTWLTVRNDDIYSFRWADPQYARDYVKAMPSADKLSGFYMGGDGYCWGRDFLSTEPVTPGKPRPLVMDRQWLSFALWGRLSYEPSLPDALFERMLGVRHPSVPAAKLMAASVVSSRIIPQITRFFWGDLDLKWFPEACLSHPRRSGFYSVRHFVEGDAMPDAGVLNIRQWRARYLAGEPMPGQTPPQVADALEQFAQDSLKLVGELRSQAAASDRELHLTLGDYEAMSHLGNYYAEKIRAACDLALFDRAGDESQRASAVKHLESALNHWKRYAAVATQQYHPALYNRIGFVDLNALTARVAADVDIAKNWKSGTVTNDGAARRTERPFRK
jgi:hypothetical protein